MEQNYHVCFISSHDRRICELKDVALDEAVSFAIILFDKYARLVGDNCLLFEDNLNGGTRLIRSFMLNREMRMVVKVC